MYGSLYVQILKTLRMVLLGCVVIFSFFISFADGKLPWVTPMMVAVAVMSLVALISCYKAYHDGTGRPREGGRIPMDVLYRVVFHWRLNGKSILGLEKCLISDENKQVLPQGETIVYQVDLPPPIRERMIVDYVMMIESGSSQRELVHWHTNGYEIIKR